MSRYSLSLLVAMACLMTTPLLAQEPAAPPPLATRPAPAGPRLEPELRSYQPTLAFEREAPASAAAAEHISISASTLGLILLIVLVIVLV